jgi:hypothetical protein
MHFSSLASLAALSLTFLYPHSNCAAISQHDQDGHLAPRDNDAYISVYPRDSKNQTETAAIEKFLKSITGAKFVNRLTFFDDPPEVILGWTLVADPSVMKSISSQPGVVDVTKAGDEGDDLELQEAPLLTSSPGEIYKASRSTDEGSQYGATPSRVKRDLTWYTQAGAPWNLVSLSHPS